MAQRTPGVRTTPAVSLWRASTFPLLLLAALLLYILPANALDTQGSSLFERATDELVTRASDWNAFKGEGQKMYSAMNGDQEAANHAVGALSTSQWTNYEDLEKYGWVVDKGRDPEETNAQCALEEAFTALDIGDVNNKKILITHEKDATVNDITYKASDGYYQSLFNVKDGVIVADDNSSPVNEHKDWPKDKFVPLKQWSDVIFLLWERLAKNKAKGLKHIFQSIVINPQSLDIMRKAVGKPGSFEQWKEFSPMKEKGKTFKPGSDAYNALLYSPNGRGIGWLLIQHKAQLGAKKVSEITVFGNEDNEPFLHFKIDNV